MRDYLGLGGKVVICGDRAAFCVAPVSEGGAGEDSLGEFLSGIMGADYLSEMGSPFDKPYIYCAAEESVTVFGVPMALEFDSLLVYRECPWLRDLSWIKTEESPPAGYFAQPLLAVLNPDVPEADMVTYAEYLDTGQSVLINFDLSASVNHTKTFCTGGDPIAPPYDAAAYEGRVELIRLILEDVFGLPSAGGGTAGNDRRPDRAYGWRLAQNAPNPVFSSTEIRFEVPHRTEVSIGVYNTLGQAVRILINGSMAAGEHSVIWDGCNASGVRVSSGVYFCRMQAEGYANTRKMLILN